MEMMCDMFIYLMQSQSWKITLQFDSAAGECQHR